MISNVVSRHLLFANAQDDRSSLRSASNRMLTAILLMFSSVINNKDFLTDTYSTFSLNILRMVANGYAVVT